MIFTGNLFDGTVILISHASPFITIIFILISRTCYAAVIVFKFY